MTAYATIDSAVEAIKRGGWRIAICSNASARSCKNAKFKPAH